HPADALAVLGAFGADLGALLADVRMVRRIEKHEVRRSSAYLGTRHHQSDVLRFDVLPAGLQAVGHRRPETHLVAAQAFVDARL
ncbi:hypothetical protein, partial [Shewanella algae]|uniref:hypothetical protein n=1 Tax=Shewanella algae TaxID=38313 RepID=UPI00313D6DFE